MVCNYPAYTGMLSFISLYIDISVYTYLCISLLLASVHLQTVLYVVVDGTGKTFKVMYDSLGPLLASAPNTFSGYIIPSIGCDPTSKLCGGSSVVCIFTKCLTKLQLKLLHHLISRLSLPLLNINTSCHVLYTIFAKNSTHFFTQVSIIHYGPADDLKDAGWMKNFTSLPHLWTAAGLTQGGCGLHEYNSFYEYELTIPNVTYTAGVSDRV